MNKIIYKDFDEIKPLRKNYITGTAAAAVCGKSEWITKQQLYDRMVDNQEKESNYMMQRGLFMEPFLIEKANEKTELNFEKCNFFLYDDNTFLAGTPDALDYKTNTLLECKTTTKFIADAEDIPIDYIYQINLYMYLMNSTQAYLIFDTKFDYKLFILERNDEIIEEIRHNAFEFMTKNILYNQRPESQELVIDELDNAVEADATIKDIYIEFQEYRQAKKDLEKRLSILEKELKAYAENYENVVSDDRLLFRYPQYSRTAFDSSKFKSDHPELYNEYMKETTYRRLI